MKELRPFAVFDIDGTLIRWQLFHAVVHELAKKGYIKSDDHDIIRTAHMQWKNREKSEGFSDYEHALVTTYFRLIKDIEPSLHDQVIQEVVAKYKDQTFTYTRDLVRYLKTKGYLLFAVSGSHHEAVNAVAEHHGFDAAVGCTFELKDGRFTGICNTPIFDKKAALDALTSGYAVTYEDSYAIGDSMSDSPLLAAVTHPIAFNPDQRLFKEAKIQKWPIVVERKNVVYKLMPDESGYTLV